MKSQIRFFLVFLWAMLLGMNTSVLAHDYVISFDAPTASEGSNLTFTVTLDQVPYDGDVVTVSYATTAMGSATPGSDFNPTFGDLVFDGTFGGTQTFTVATNSDTDVEPDETIQIRFIASCPDVGSGGNPTCNTSWGGAATATGTIIDDDHNITVTANASQREDAGNYDFVVAIAPPVTGTETVSVSYRTNDGTADGSDYTDTDGGPITFTNGSAGSVTVSVPVTDDATMEGDEEFDFELYNPSGNVESYDAHTTATILNDDYLITSTLADATVDENGAAPLPNNNELTYTITIDRIPTGTDTVTMPYATADGSAVVGADYTAAGGNIVFDSSSGSVSQDITIPIVDDPVRESDEQFSLTIGPAGSNFEISGPTSADITIEDNDYDINISNDFSVDVDAGTADVLVILLPARTAGDTVTFDYTTTDDTATAGNDYTASGDTHSFSDVTPANPFTITVPILNDGTQTGAESFTLDLSNISTGNATFVDDQCKITINDHEFTMTAGNDVTVSEDAGTATFTVTLDRNPVGGEEVTVDYETIGGTATQDTDYTLTSGTLTIDATDSNDDKVITVPILEDTLQELLEEYTIELSNPSTNTLINAGDEVTTGRIADNDYHVNAFADLAVDENAGMAQLTVTLGHNVAPGDSVDFTVSYAGGTPAATEGNSGDWDYTASQTVLTIGPGTNSGTIDIPINDDAMVELAEKFIVTLSPTSGNIDTSHASAVDLDAEVTINIDEKYHFSIDNVNVVEGETTVDFTVTLVSPTPLQSEHNGLQINFSTQDASAIDPDDYEAVIGGTVSFSDAADTQPITITIHDDILDEGAAEQFLVNLTGASIPEIVEFDVNQGTCTIQDTDYIITPSWNIHGSVTLESPVGTSRAITSGSAVAIDNNEQAQFTVAADYRIHQVTIDSADPTTLGYVTVSVIDAANHLYTFEANTPQGARTIDVIFDHQIEMTAGGDGTITHTTGSGTSVHDGGPTAAIADHNEEESFLIEADSDTCVTNVEVDGSSLGAFIIDSDNWNGDLYTFSSVIDNHTIAAEFGTATITVNLGADDGATGTDEDLFIQDEALSSSGWRAYATDSSYTASGAPFASGFHGESFTLPTDTPCDTQYILIQFLDVDGWLKPVDIELDLQDSFQDQTVEGLYDANSHVLTIVAGNGSVNLDPMGEPAVGDERYLYPADTDVELTAVADADWYFQRWLGDVAEVPDPTSLTITITMDRDRTVEAVFVQGCQDNDNDGYTTDDLASLGCFVSPEIDCDDTNAEIFPGAEEICGDGIDQDCSGSDLVCSGDDADDDGDGYTENQGDCDDTNAAIHPGAYDDPTTAADEDCFDGAKEMGSEQLCVDASDVPANAARKPAPPMIMFLLDDSGSMDWEFMTDDSNQLFHGKYYVHDYHYNARAYGDDHLLTDSQKREWLSQWAGYNRIYFDPNVNYAPWPKWEDVAANVTYSGSEAGAVTAHEFPYDADNTSFPDRAFVDGFTHADMDTPRLNTVDNGDGFSWNHTDDEGNVLRFNLNDEFMRVTAGGGQQVVVTRDNSSTGDSTIADAIGLSVRGDLELNVAHEWTWYDASNRPEIIFDDGDGDTVYSETDDWYDSGGGAEWEWAGQARWSEDVGEKAAWRLNLSNAQEGDYYLYAWMDDYGSRDDNALYSIFYYDGSGELQSAEFRIDQSPANSTGSPANGARWVRLSDTTYPFSEQSGTDEIIIPNAHYYTWNDVNSDGVLNWDDTDGDGKIDTSETLSEEVYLVTIPGSGHNHGDYELKYYFFNDVNENFQIEDGELIEKTGADIPASVIPARMDQAGNSITDADELAYVVRQDFADWFSFYRRRMLTAKAAVGLTVADMARVELGVHTLNRTFHEPLVFIADGNSQEMVDYLTTIYNINPSGSTPLRRGLYEVGKYFEAGTSGDYTNLQTTEGLCSGDSSVFYDAQDVDDADTCDDSGGECQRAYVIAMTDGYYDSTTATVGNVDGSVEVVLRDAASNSMADISMLFYNSDLDTSLGDNVPAEGFDDATWQHMVTFAVSFGVFGHFNPDLFPDCLPGCETPGQAGCPELTDLGVATWSGNPVVYDDGTGPFDDMCPDWHDNNPPATYSPNSVDDLFHASINGRGKFLNAANPADLVAAMQTIKDLIADQTGTASSVAINARKIQEDTLLFQTIYDSGDWGGDVLAKCLDITGEMAACGRVSCESGCNSAYESCMGLCSVGDTTCVEVCVDSRQTCLTTNSCSDNLTCNEAHVDCIESCGGDAGCEVGCDNTKTSCQDDPPEVQWSATKRLDLVTAASRRIITADITDDNTDGKLGIAFQWSALPAAMKTSLQGESHILDYLRGDRQYERQNDTGNVHNYRNRSSRLGDFINSEPYHYANSSLGIDWVFVGANDGMLHVFDGQTGDEVFAYIPNMSFDNLHLLSQETYNDNHKFYVDGYLTVKDLGDRVILIGGMGKGGKGYYALDLTAAAVSSDIEADAADIVLWEYSQATMSGDADIVANLGYSFSRPQIIRSNDTTSANWLLVFANGYESNNLRSVLFLVGMDTFGNTQWTRMIDSGTGNGTDCNGLSTPAIIYPQGDGRNDFIFAGDLLGNLWKFDISDADRSVWGSYFNDGTDPQPLFQARSNAGYRQPITMQPDVTTSCVIDVPGYMVAFGTGRLLDPDVDAPDTSVQSVYGVWDWSAAWIAAGAANPEQTYLGYFEPESGASTASCTASCDAILGDDLTADTCIFDCDGNTECEESCHQEHASCVANCSAIRTLSHMDTVIGDAAAADYVALLRQTQVYVGGIDYASDGTIREQKYGETDLDAWDQIVRVMSDNGIDWLLPSGKDDFIADTNKLVKHVGWYFDLPANGERIVRDMTIANHKLIFTSTIPTDSPCESGGTSHHWAVEVCSGGRIDTPFFDLNDDGVISGGDYIDIGTPGNPIWTGGSSFQDDGLSPAPILIEVRDNPDRLYVPGGSTGSPGFGMPVQYWRELDWQ